MNALGNRTGYRVAVAAALVVGAALAFALPSRFLASAAEAWKLYGIGGFARYVTDGILCF